MIGILPMINRISSKFSKWNQVVEQRIPFDSLWKNAVINIFVENEWVSKWVLIMSWAVFFSNQFFPWGLCNLNLSWGIFEACDIS